MLNIEPSSIDFGSIEPGSLYVVTFSVRNVGKVAQRIRLQAPKSSIFALNYVPTGVIAPGLDLRAEVECLIPKELHEHVFSDKVVAFMGDEKVEIPITAAKPHLKLDYPTTLNLGNLQLNQSIVKEIQFQNLSHVGGSIRFSAPRNSNCKLSSMKLDFVPCGNPGSVSTIKLTMEGKELGHFRECLLFHDLRTNEEFLIEVIAQVIQPVLSIVSSHKGGSFDVASFGNLFFGEKQRIEAFLVNSGPQALSFSVRFEDDDEEKQNGAQSETNDQGNRHLTLFPMDGIVKPYSELAVTFNFSPTLTVPERGFQQTFRKDTQDPVVFKRLAIIECLDSSQSISIPVEGIAYSPHIEVNPSLVRFGDCPVNDRRDVLLTLRNTCQLPYTFSFPAIANFKFTPSSGKILADESVSITASFIPPQLGLFKVGVPIDIQNGLKTFSLKLVGESYSGNQKKVLTGGIDKLPQDFATEFKFVNPEEEAAARREKKLQKDKTATTDIPTDLPVPPPIIAASSESDDIYGTENKVSDTATLDQRSAYLSQMNAFYKQHNARYNEFLRTSAVQRTVNSTLRKKMKLLKSGAVDFSDPFGVNMGMERGLDEPELKLPLANESLFLTSATSNGNAEGGSKGRLPVDENRLIQKKYPPEPATQAQFRDCSSELDQEELKLVTASHKIIDFGKVCVGSVSYKNFVVYNGLKKAIKVTIEDLEIELQQSKPLSQVIPEGSVAGFDICVTSRSIGKLKRSFTWKINNNHSFKVHILAEVVPIELIMNKAELELSFPEDSTKQTLTSEIILTNPGNAYADFLWGSAGAFTCDPEKGSIAPGKSAVISITWDPHSNKRTEEDLGLHVSGGVDQVLKVRGHLPETKAEFVDKRIQLGLMAVGTEKEFTSTIMNTGENPLVIFINNIDAQLGIKVEPTEAFIQPHGSIDLNIVITPKVPRSYDNVIIGAKVRGGKSISIRLNGTSIIPLVDFEPSMFKFGNVTVESVARIPFNISNKSSIAATLILDLTSYGDFAPSLLNPLEILDVSTKEFGPLPFSQEDEAGNHISLIQQKSKGFDDRTKKTQKKKQASNCWKLTIPPNSTMLGEIIFRPTVAKKYSFKLPLQLLGVTEDKSLYRDLTGIAIASVLSASSYVVDFGDKVVSRDPLSRVSYFQETTLTNISQTGVSFIIHEGLEEKQIFDNSIPSAQRGMGVGEPQQIFFVSPLKVDLAPGASTKIRVTFLPQESANYHKRLGIFIKDQDDTVKPYLTLLCIGSGVYPCLSFDSEYIQLPSVPIGITSRAMFTIFNHGYASLEIKHRISPNVAVPLDVSYPDGNQVGIMVESIRVVVSCRLDQSSAWAGKIEFYDMDGERFFLAVGGMSDNCLLSNYWFIKNYSAEYGFIGLEDNPVQFLPVTQIQELRQLEAKRREDLRKQRSLERQKAVEGKLGTAILDRQAKKDRDETSQVSSEKSSKARKDTIALLGKNSVQSDSDSGVEIEHATTGLPEEIEGKFLIKWLNRNFSKRQFDPESFPQCILENQGDWLVEIFEQMCGKKVNIAAQKPTRGIESKQEDQKRATEKSRLISLADKAMFKFQQIINFLINCGALLNHINVIWLLNKEDYLLMLEHELTRDKMQRITPAMLSNKRKQWNEVWLEVSRRSWLEVLYQAIKVFVLSRINFKELCTLPGIVLSQKTLSQPLLTSSRNKNEKLKKSTGPTVPKDMVASNVFTHHEQVLLFWLSYHLERAEGLIDEGAQSSSNAFLSSPSLSFNKRVSDLSTTFTDFFPFCQLFHSHISEIAKKGEPLYAYTTFDRSRVEELYLRFEESCLQYHVEVPSITSEEIMKSNRNLLLLLVHMYLNLPHLIPKTKIEFSGMLGIPISKRIELRNPSKRPLAYAVSLKGSEDYLLEKTEVTVPPESSTEFLVTLNARFSQSVESKIYFWNRRDPNNANGPTLCFQCFSQIKGIQALEKLTRTVSLFEFETIGVTVKNPYNRDIVAKIKIEVKFCPRGVEDYLQGSKSKKRSHHEIYRDIPLIKPLEGDLEESSLLKSEEAKSGFSIDDWDLENMFRQPFWFHDDAISIPKGSSKVLNIFMLPFELGSYICQIVFLEPELGEFCYEIHADVTLPKSGERLAIDVQQGIIARLSLSFNSKNVQFERALSTLTESRIKNANKKIRARSVITNFLLSQVTNEEFGYCNFLLDFTVPVFSFNRKFNLVSEYVRWSSKGEHAKSSTLGNVKVKKQQRNAIELYQATNEVTEASESLINRNILTFSAERAGLYKTIAVIRPDDNPFDIRCVELLLTAKIPDVKMVLEFNGPARTKLSQEIPIHNETDADWSLSVASSGKNFSVPKIVNVPAKQTAILEVSFYSLVTGSYEGKLQLKNPETNDIFEYQLIGVAEDALAEDTLNFRCSARKKSVFSIFIPNLESILGPPKSLQQDDHPTRSFKVETDLPFAIIKESAKIPAEGGNFEFSVNCPMGGELNGYVSFKDIDTQAVFWYAIVVDVTSPQEEKTIEVQATVRQAVVVEITLDNPLKDELVFDVTLQGEGLIGQPLLTLLPGDAPQQNVYELIFSPLFPGPSIGKVSFWNELVGEVWYKLQLVALPASAIEVPLVDCMLGSETTIYPEIENPLNESITFTIDVVDTEHFAVSHPKLSLKSFEQGKFAVNFRPSNFNEIYSTQVRLRNKKLGEIVYNLSGKGLLPGVLPTTIIEGPIFEIVSENILFRNPFPHPLPVEIILVADRVGSELEQVFSLLRKTSESVVPAKSPFHVPISFSPQSLGTYNAVLQIRSFVAGHNLLWCYPIQGLAEVGGVIRLPQLKTSSKSSLIKEQVITLSGLRTSQKIETLIPWSLSDFVVSLKTEEDIRKLVNRSFKIQLLEVLLIQESETKTEIGIRTRLLFEPLRMFSGKVEISIKLKNQGKWKAAVDLEATSPEPDDTIKLTAKVGDLDRISFKLNNRFLGYSPFQAYFASSSSPHFTVEPKSGLLAPYDTDGTTFVVTFAPREYGFIESGILNILTEDTQWTFQVKGAYPDLSHHSSQVKSKINFKR